jgi:hypothetical protein
MNKMEKSLLILVCSSILVGCGFKGVVTRKNYEQQREWTETYSLVVSNGKQYNRKSCRVRCLDDEDFIISVQGENDKREFYLKDKKFFEKIKIGDKFTYDPSIAEQEDPVKKQRICKKNNLKHIE